VLELDDGLEIYPAHGAGSPCGGSIGDRQSSTVGYERRHSPKLQAKSEGEFVRQLLASVPPAPFYYLRMKKINAAGPRVLGCLPPIQPLDAKQIQDAMASPHALVLDTREIEAFGGAHIEGALNIPLREEFPIWAGWMLRPEQQLLLVPSSEDALDELRRQLLGIGLEEIRGFLLQGMRGWTEAGMPFQRLQQMSVHELKERVVNGHDGLQVLDVRRDDEWAQGHIPSAGHVFAPYLPQRLRDLDREKPVATYCGSGYRAGIAASLLQRSGFREVMNIPGSMMAWKAAGYPVEGAESPTASNA
jgi:hydroxyacylglutathione hydrolase